MTAGEASDPRPHCAEVQAFSGLEPVWLMWSTVLAFIRIGTSGRVFEEPLSVPEAETIVTGWLDAAAVGTLSPGERYWEIMRELLRSAQITGPLVMDAALAAVELQHRAALCTTDRDFLRFPGVRLVDPTAA